MFIGVQGQSAEMPNPGVQSQFIAKSGGNQFRGEYYVDFNNNAMQGSNIPEAVIAGGIRPHSNEMERYFDTSINVGGPIKKDKLWWFGTYRRLKTAVEQPQFQFDKITPPYSHDAGIFFERQLSETIGLRTGFVYKTEDDLIANYQPGRSILNGAFSVPFTFVDVGVDAVRGTSDDRNVTLYGMPTTQAASFPTDRVVMNVPRYSRFKTVQLSVRKRYSNKLSFQIGGGYSWTTDFPQGFPANPSQPGVYDRTDWGFGASGTYDAPYGPRLSPVFRHQSGVNFARQISVGATAATAFGLILPASIVYADPANANREENIWLLDVRAERSVTFTDRVRAQLFLDLFNITNSHKSELLTRTTGANYPRPGNILAPFTTRVGMRFVF
ncbi:MAG: hypothetical protein Q7R30_07285 [Acidobacteriota bacterium]|nr:hypothetical protein [Acidobacteriota bacterium]